MSVDTWTVGSAAGAATACALTTKVPWRSAPQHHLLIQWGIGPSDAHAKFA